MDFLLKRIDYHNPQHKWNICADLKVVAILMGLQGGYVKYPCHLCEWNSRARSEHYGRESWPLRKTEEMESEAEREAEEESEPEEEEEAHSSNSSDDESVDSELDMESDTDSTEMESTEAQHPILEKDKNILKKNLVDRHAIIFPPLHIMLGLMTQFIKTLVKLKPGGDRPIKRLHKMFPKLTDAKINAGVFIGPSVHRILDDGKFYDSLPKKHQQALKALKDVVEHFLGNNRAWNYAELVTKMLRKYEEIGALISLKCIS